MKIPVWLFYLTLLAFGTDLDLPTPLSPIIKIFRVVKTSDSSILKYFTETTDRNFFFIRILSSSSHLSKWWVAVACDMWTTSSLCAICLSPIQMKREIWLAHLRYSSADICKCRAKAGTVKDVHLISVIFYWKLFCLWDKYV